MPRPDAQIPTHEAIFMTGLTYRSIDLEDAFL